MDTFEILVSSEALLHVFVVLLYLPVCLVCYWQIIPRLSPTSRLIASVVLAAQVLVIVVSFAVRPSSEYEEWLWLLDKEWNIPSIIQSLQLAMVGGAALLTSRLARSEPAWQRLFLAGFGLIFLYFGLDEFFSWKFCHTNWKTCYRSLGIAIAGVTMIVALFARGRARLWFIGLLIGMWLMGTGGIIFDSQPRICGSFAFFSVDGCLKVSQAPDEIMELLGGWLALVATLGLYSDAAPTLHRRVRYTLFAAPALWIVLLLLASPIRDPELWFPGQAASVQFESRVHLRGYQTADGGLPSSIFIYVPADAIEWGLGYSVHLVDRESGDSIASVDELVDRENGYWPSGHGYVQLYRQELGIELPQKAPVNRAIWVILTFWRQQDGSFIRQKVLKSELQLLDQTQVVLGEVVIPAPTADALSDPLAVFDIGFALDAVELPETVRAGETLTIPFAWRSDVEGVEDHVQFLHLGHAESGEWWVYDQQPLGDRLPTHLWYKGLADSETWQVPLPADLAPGRYRVFTGLYRTRDQERVPARDGDGDHFGDNRVPLGTLIIER